MGALIIGLQSQPWSSGSARIRAEPGTALAGTGVTRLLHRKAVKTKEPCSPLETEGSNAKRQRRLF